MSNLLSASERWLSLTGEQLIADAKKNQNFTLAERTVEAVTPTLHKVHEGYLSEAGDIEVFLYVAMEDNKRVLASIVHAKDNETDNEEKEDTGFVPRLTVYDENAKMLVAAFLCDFPNALFSVEGGHPIVMFIEVPMPKNNQQSTGGYLPGEKIKRFVSLSNMVEAVQNQWYKMCIAVPGGKKESASRTESCATAAAKRPG